MPHVVRHARRLVLWSTLVLAVGALQPLAAQSDATVVFVVRHAERAEDGTNDPPISEAGWERARLLAEMLRDAGVTHIHSSDFQRTRQTGEPLSEASGIDIEIYDPRDLTGLAEQLRGSPGRHVVLGHSNTSGPLVTALGGDAGGPIEEMEYDRLYVVTLTADGASTVVVRFGDRFEG